MKFIKNTNNIKIDINFEEMKSTCTILNVLNEHFGQYQCKAINDVSEVSTKAKLDLASGPAVISTNKEPQTTLNKHLETKDTATSKFKSKVKAKPKKLSSTKDVVKVENNAEVSKKTDNTEILHEEFNTSSIEMTSTSLLEILTSRKIIEEENIEIIEETEAVHVKIYKEAYSQEQIDNFKITDEVNNILDTIEANRYGTGEPPLRELATIGYLLKKGVSINEVLQLYYADFFPALKIPESQSALVQLVERQGYENLIAEVLNIESDEDEALLASTVGFRAFMRMVELTQCMVEDIIANFKFEDFVSQEWKYREIKEDSVIDVTETHISSITNESSLNGE